MHSAFTVLPMDLASSGDLFNLNTDEVIWDCRDVHKNMSDVLGEGVGETLEEAREDLKRKLNILFMKMEEEKLKLSPIKFKIGHDVQFVEF